MSTIRFTRVSTARALAGAGITAALLTLATVPPAHAGVQAAETRACIFTSSIGHHAGKIVGTRNVICNPPGVEGPAPVTVQRSTDGTTNWVTVAHDDGNEGVATYVCAGTGMRYYRLKEATHKKIRTACS
ncbi:hypothetical protein [Actinomadura rudentiformis]|uniref:Secreted protein n=1 Tax=Actinomadura rudentiformis TaxID=359158 RepID=A0A6H9Z7Q6_9ACTN|nr:hypothetical protein [Actinomadura rudentiformis]KAB2352386.1 hypothetical protein F8566_01470 [Actinomadura rudentiformis]